MDKIKRISAAVIAMSLACTMLASCGGSDDSSSEGGSASKADTASAAAESKEDAASEGDVSADESAESAESTESAEDGEDEEVGVIMPDTSFKPTYEYNGYDAFLMFGDASWFWGNWLWQGAVHSPDFDPKDPATYGYGIDADITGDGEYTVAITKDSIAYNNGLSNPNVLFDEEIGDGRIASPAEGTVVFCVDIVGLMDGTEISGLDENGVFQQVNETDEEKASGLTDGDNHYDKNAKGDYKVSDLKVEVTSIKCDGQEIEFDPTKIRCGNIENNNNCYRIEIYNDYGSTATDPAIDPFKIAFFDKLEVTFTIEGLGEVKTFPEVEAFTPTPEN